MDINVKQIKLTYFQYAKPSERICLGFRSSWGHTGQLNIEILNTNPAGYLDISEHVLNIDSYKVEYLENIYALDTE